MQEETTKPAAPRVTEKDVQDAIVGEHYFTARHGHDGASFAGVSAPGTGWITWPPLIC